MNALNAAARLLAHARQSSVPIAEAYDICPDPSDGAFAIVPMRVVGEELIQATGYGIIGQAPQIAVEHNAMSRQTHFLVPFADALEAYLKEAVVNEFPRIYIPNPAALELLTVMAYRYENAGANPNPDPRYQAAPQVIRLGYLLRIVKELYHMPGQQIVVVMPEKIKQHFVTGQIPPKDGHLGALTVWLAAPTGSTTTQTDADQLVLRRPAAAMLTREQDEFIDGRLHRIRNVKTAAERLCYKDEIEAVQRAGVISEWGMLEDAHTAFWGRRLRTGHYPELVAENVSWLKYRLENHVLRGRRAISMSKRYEVHEYHADLHRGKLLANDTMRFEQERASGNAFVASITAVRKTPRGINPKDHRIDLDVQHQHKIRLRVGQHIHMIGGAYGGEIRSFNRTATGYSVSVRITDGIKSVAPGGPYRWAEKPSGDPSFNAKYYTKIKNVLGLP